MTLADESPADALTSLGGELTIGGGGGDAVPVRGVELLLPTYDTVRVPFNVPALGGAQARLTVQVAPEGSAPLHVVPEGVTDTPAPVTLVPVIVIVQGRVFCTGTSVDVDWPTCADGNAVPANVMRGCTINALYASPDLTCAGELASPMPGTAWLTATATGSED